MGVATPASAIVFAPHPDDETLPCGGTVVTKRRLGADVAVVVMTDGAAAHFDLIEPSRLRRLRRHETLRAVTALGLERRAVTFLDYPDGRLAEHCAEAVLRVRTILDDLRPAEVFIPYRDDVHPDHVATSAIVRQALEQCHPKPAVYEYPVWLLFHWPLVELGGLAELRWTAGKILRLLHHFDASTRLDPSVLDRKREAFAHHRTQAMRLYADPRWPILADLSHGEFLALFFDRYELFHRVAPGAHRSGGRAKA